MNEMIRFSCLNKVTFPACKKECFNATFISQSPIVGKHCFATNNESLVKRKVLVRLAKVAELIVKRNNSYVRSFIRNTENNLASFKLDVSALN